jgi:predicted PurR-regulated permease PerM
MIGTEMIDVLKWGPLGLAALLALWAASLLTIELRRTGQVRSSAQRLIVTFMVFSMALAVLAYGVGFFQDRRLNELKEQQSRTLDAIREQLNAMNNSIMFKLRDAMQEAAKNSDNITAGRIRDYYRAICESFNEIANNASATVTCDPNLF